MDLNTLQYFIKTAQIQHMSNAAIELNISQSALSTNIKKLEDDLGVQLFDRRGKYIYLNEYGTIFMEYAQSIVAQYNSAKFLFNNMKQQSENTVSVSMPALTSFPGLMSHIKAKCPDVVFRNIQTNHKERVNMLIKRDISFCIMGAKLSHPDIEETIMSMDNLVIIVPNTSPLASKKELDLIETMDYEFANVSKYALVNVEEHPASDLELYCSKAGFSPKIGFWCDQFYEIIEAIRDGNFIGMVAERILDGYNMTGISVIKIKSPKCFSNLRLYRLRNSYETKMSRKVREAILEYFQQENVDIIDSRGDVSEISL